MHTAEAWLTARGTRHISGPFNLSINQECGVLVEGFDTPDGNDASFTQVVCGVTGRARVSPIEGYACLLGGGRF